MNKKTTIIIYAVLGTLLLGMIVAAVLLVLHTNSQSDANDALEKEKDALQGDLSDKEDTIDSLREAKAALEAELADLQAKLEEAEQKYANAGTLYSAQIADLNTEIVRKNNEIADLEADIARYETVYNIDVRDQAKRIDAIVEYIEKGCPVVRMEDKIDPETEEMTYKWVKSADIEAEAKAAYDDEAAKILAAGGTPPEYEPYAWIGTREDVFYPSISVYYEDLTTGYQFGYEADKSFYSASVVKAPYVLSVLQEIAADEARYLEELEAEGKEIELVDTDEDGEPDTEVYVYSDQKYDLSEILVYDKKKMQKEGSGKIQEMDDGTEFTIRELIEYALLYSDNIAYDQLKKRFGGYDPLYALCRKVKANSVLRNANYMSAKDAGRIFKEIWNFTEDNERYGPFMAELMKKANHTVIIPYGVSPNKAMHKYGWDVESYHDAAVVLYKDKPYVLSVFTDLDCGGNEVNKYLQELVKMINSLHSKFYS